jgi:hypothetical protein
MGAFQDAGRIEGPDGFEGAGRKGTWVPSGKTSRTSKREPRARLDWIADVLLGTGESSTATVQRQIPPGHRAVMSFWAFPSSSRPYVLVPEQSPKSAAEALRRLGNPPSKGKRLAETLLAAGMATGLPLRILPGRLHLTISKNGADPKGTLADHLREVLGTDELSVAVILGHSRRPNRKPVLRLVSATGETIAFTKVGWNELSRQLIRNEAQVLRALESEPGPPKSFDVPHALYAGTWRGLELLVVSAAPRDHWLHDGPPIDLPEAATQEVAELGVGVRAPLRSSPFWRRTVERVNRTEPGSDTGRELRLAAERIERDDGESELFFGRSHGDWTPWNMCIADGRLFVWDWERSEDDVPMGLDAAHFDFEVRAKIKGEPPDRAVRGSLMRARRSLQRMGIDGSLAPLLARLHLIEMSLRFQEGQATGLEVRDSMYLSALRELLVAVRPGTA